MSWDDVLAVRYATLTSTKGELYYRWGAYGEPDGEQSMDYFFYVLRSGAETLVVDSGFHPEVGRRRGRTCLTEPREALERLGIDGSAIDRVIVTHLHYDHIGNLDAFPHAELLVPARELEFWTGDVARNVQFWAHVEESEIAYVAAAHREGRVATYGGPPGTETELAPGVTAISVGGHSPGQHVLVVETAAGRAVLTSDAVHLYDELEQRRPFGVLADLEEMYEGFETIRRLGEASGSVVVPGHDPDVTRRFPVAAGVEGVTALKLA